MGLVWVEEVDVARAEDGRIQRLGDERDALGRSIPMDSEDQDELGEEVGDVPQVAEKLSLGW